MARKYYETAPGVKPELATPKKNPPKTKPHIAKKEIDARTYICVCCGVEYTNQVKNFPASSSPFYKGNNGRLPVCWDCMESIFEQYVELLHDKTAAIRRICLHFDYYYYASIAESCSPSIGAYLRNLHVSNRQKKTFDDYIFEEGTDKASAAPARPVVSDSDGDAEISQRDVDRWGYGFAAEDYQFLNSELEDWKSRCVVSGKSQEMIVQELCVLSLQKHKRLIAEDHDGYRKYVDLYTKALKEANLSPRQEEASDKLAEIPLGKMIERFEKEEPIPEPRPEWQDVDGIMKIILVYFLGHLCKMLGLKNRYAAAYESEMARWSVTVDELNGADSETVYDYMLEHDFDGVSLGEADDGKSV